MNDRKSNQSKEKLTRLKRFTKIIIEEGIEGFDVNISTAEK